MGTSNALTSLRDTVPYVPGPGNSILEGVLAVGGAFLALWATHLHRPLNARPERRGAEGIEVQKGRAIPRPLQAACWAFSFVNSTDDVKRPKNCTEQRTSVTWEG